MERWKILHTFKQFKWSEFDLNKKSLQVERKKVPKSCTIQSKDFLCECNIQHVCMNDIHCALKNGS